MAAHDCGMFVLCYVVGSLCIAVKVRELASRIRTLKKAGEDKPFVAVNLKRHVIEP